MIITFSSGLLRFIQSIRHDLNKHGILVHQVPGLLMHDLKHATRLTRYVRNMNRYLQLRIRTYALISWRAAQVQREYIYEDAGHRASVRLCLLARVSPRHADIMQKIVLDRWNTSAELWTLDELRAAVKRRST